jgi:transposase
MESLTCIKDKKSSKSQTSPPDAAAFERWHKENVLASAESASVGHLGLVARGMQELGIIDIIDKLIDPQHPQQRISMGRRSAAMIMNLMSFHNRTLYATPELLAGFATEALLGEGASPQAFNDDALASCLDAITKFGSEKFFNTVALNMLGKIKLGGSSLRLDSTSMKLHGAYQNSSDGGSDDGGIRVTFGHSKDGRPDLKQVMLTLATTGPADLPVLAKPQDGNASDKKEFVEIIEAFQQNFNIPAKVLWVADSALYSKRWLQSQGRSADEKAV